MKFTKEEVLRQVQESHDDSPVRDAWMNLADNWLASGDGNYQENGFRGWNQRTPNEILIDFHLNGLLTVPLNDEEVNQLLSDENDEDEVIAFDEVVARAANVLLEMDGKELAELCNNQFGMGIEYIGDNLFKQNQN